MISGKIANHLTASCDFYLEDGVEDKLLQFRVEAIGGNDVSKTCIGLEGMASPIHLHWTPIVSKTEITSSIKDGRCLRLIVNNESTLFQNLNLLRECKWLLCVVHIIKMKSRPVALPARGRVPGSIGCKGTSFSRNFQRIWQKSA